MTPDPLDEACQKDLDQIRAMGWLRAWWQFLAPAGWATQWYWPEGTRGKVWNLLHGRGWSIR